MTNLRLRYQTLEFENTDIHLCTLRDRQQFHDPNNEAEKLGISSASWPLFGIVWPSSIVLASHMLHYDTTKKRILEVGCGIGLTSLLLNTKNVDITATDHHPAASEFLKRNTELNSTPPISFHRTDWADEDDDLGLFDVIIGSDLLYEEFSIIHLAHFINRHAQKKCEVVIVDPGRGKKNKLAQKMRKFGFLDKHSKPTNLDSSKEQFNGHIIEFHRS
ncbi:methyltransferase domain-containing protein [Parashewanella spongiae]|uniref:Methyltransferase domain-containing protein n=1 Tax=Parashewanella spongiae TaxID=342950 RepID=A0A3A6TFU9_9GAMM|nr:methyltransferase domain-containing protein [Parashewanella spongiae]MCL1079702.1 protein N-lysine methyltransferase family protein [Parashewanella spongiae]RJY07170.1 methyltransferase domain-containing protein [Parashewanella spongiae]